ncbi:S8 family serine peptidase [Desulfosarcina variabilis]|uniref:S8 family serine peptidase n=1 Tax=Desulfosarcina variabilis TaxID=2300 RepID=UPI003AFB1538
MINPWPSLLKLIVVLFACSLLFGCPSTDNDPPPETASSIIITDVTPSSGLADDEITVTCQADKAITDARIFLSGEAVEVSAADETKLTFVVPSGFKEGTSCDLYVQLDNARSNSVSFSIYPSIREPEVFVDDDFGNKVAVDYVLVSLVSDYSNREGADEIAARIGAQVTGELPLTELWQFKVEVADLAALESLKNTLESYAEVDFVSICAQLPEMEDGWSDTDPDIAGQRISNEVYEGAQAYIEAVDPEDPEKLKPIFTVVGAVEKGVDYNLEDFNGYGEKGRNPSNGIAIYANDVGSSSTTDRHGSWVTGLIAAEIGEGDMDTGRMAGLLAGLEGSHGGFNIIVDTGVELSEMSSVLNATERMLKAGASVINWSFGLNKAGTQNSEGIEIAYKCYDEWIFNAFKKTFTKFIRKVEENYANAVIVCAAGNDSVLVSEDSVLPAGIQSPNMLVVGGHWPYDGVSPESKHTDSNYGDRVDISASMIIQGSSDSDGSVSGTSFGAPLTVATIAAMQSINPYLSADDIRTVLRSNALPVGNQVEQAGLGDDVFTAPLSADEVGEGSELTGQGARLSVLGAINGAIDHLHGRNVTVTDPVEVDLSPGETETITVRVTVPEDKIFNTVDIMFAVDLSSSYNDDLSQFKSQAIELIEAFSSAGKDVRIGLASFVDFPIYPYGNYGDYAYRLEAPLTDDYAGVIDAIQNLSIYGGRDVPESQMEALYQLATGAGRSIDEYPELGFDPMPAGWRTGALPIVFLATDAEFHDKDEEDDYFGAGWTDTLTALKSRGIKVFGLQSGDSVEDVQAVAAETDGEAFLLSSDSAEIIETVLEAIGSATEKADVKLVPVGDYFELIQSISPEDGYTDVVCGEVVDFQVALKRGLLEPDADLTIAFRLEAVAEDVAIITSVPVSVNLN